MIVARLLSVDGEDLDVTLILIETPFPGDVVRTADGTEVRVIRRTFLQLSKELNKNDLAASIGVELEVRLA